MAFGHCVDLIVAPAPAGAAREIDPAEPARPGAGGIRRADADPAAGLEAGAGRRQIVIAWNGGREALRAVHDAMPFLKRAHKVIVFTFSARPSALRASAVLLVDHLRRHGVGAKLSDWTNTGDLRQSKRCSPASTPRTPT